LSGIVLLETNRSLLLLALAVSERAFAFVALRGLFMLVGVSNLVEGDHCTFLEGLHPREHRFHGHIDVTHLHYALEVEDFVEERFNLRELFWSGELLVRWK